MYRSILMACVLACTLSFAVHAKTNGSVTDLPDISVIGQIQGSSSPQNGNQFSIPELEFAFQNYLYPGVKADVFVALHPEESSIELEEGYVTFTDLINTLWPDSSGLDLGSYIGKKHINFGKTNSLHSEQRSSIDRALVAHYFLGGDESLSSTGVFLTKILPLPFFSQLEIGYSKPTKVEDLDNKVIHFSTSLFNTRLWNSIAIDNQELQIGFSGLIELSQNSHNQVWGIDITHQLPLNESAYLLTQAEWMSAQYTNPLDITQQLNQTGWSLGSVYHMNSNTEIGARYDWVQHQTEKDPDETQWNIYGTKQLTETTKLKAQYAINNISQNTASLVFIFGMGPHSHVLQ